MSMVTVSGFVPHKEFGEIRYASFIYQIIVSSDELIKFLVWNPINQDWDVISSDKVFPVAVPTQDVPFTQRLKEYKDWLKEREPKHNE